MTVTSVKKCLFDGKVYLEKVLLPSSSVCTVFNGLFVETMGIVFHMCNHVRGAAGLFFERVFNLILGKDYFSSLTPPCGKTLSNMSFNKV